MIDNNIYEPLSGTSKMTQKMPESQNQSINE